VRHRLLLSLAGLAPALTACSVVVPLPGPIPAEAGAAMPDAGRVPRGPDGRRQAPDAAPGDDGGDSTCPMVDVFAPMASPQVIIALDRSSTMDPRIEPIRAKLTPLLADLGRAVEVGYLEFPDYRCDPRTCCPSSPVLVEPALGSSAAIDRLLACNPMMGPCPRPGIARTPTDEALRTVQSYWPTAGPDRFVVIITDGPPRCENDFDTACFRGRSLANTLASRTLNVKTAILAITRSTLSTCLERIAELGGDLFPHGTSAKEPFAWIEDVTDPKALAVALAEVLSPVKDRICVVKLRAPRDQWADVAVLVRGTDLPYDPSGRSGWSFEPSRTGRSTAIRIGRKTCDLIESGELKPRDVQTRVRCPDCGNGAACAQ
jgi:hypothetical protein